MGCRPASLWSASCMPRRRGCRAGAIAQPPSDPTTKGGLSSRLSSFKSRSMKMGNDVQKLTSRMRTASSRMRSGTRCGPAQPCLLVQLDLCCWAGLHARCQLSSTCCAS